MIRPWFEWPSLVPGARNLQRHGAHWPGNGRTGFWIPEAISTADPKACRDAISGPEPERSLAANAAERLNRCDDGSRGADWSGHMLFRQAMVGTGKSVQASDRIDHVAHIRPAIMDVLERVSASQLDVSYVNHEAGLDPEFVGMLLNSLMPKKAGPTMVTNVTCGIWPHLCWHGEVARSSPGLFAVSGLRPHIEAWISRRNDRAWKLLPAWNGMINTINQIISARRAVLDSSIRPIPSIRGILGTQYQPNPDTTPQEQAVYHCQARAMTALGVRDVIVFNSYGRGEHLKDQAVDFTAMEREDLQTMKAFEGCIDVRELSIAELPEDPIPFDTEEIRLGSLILKARGLPPA